MSKQFDICFLDMDNVLCDFTKAAVELFAPPPYRRGDCDRWNVWESVNVSQGEFYTAIKDRGMSFWANLQPCPWLSELLSVAADLADSVRVLTHSQEWPCCYHGKAAWFEKHLAGKGLKLWTGEEKHLLANPRRLLIDDSDVNVEKWRAAGGKAILFPQPWNKAADAMDRPMYEVGRRVAELTGGDE